MRKNDKLIDFKLDNMNMKDFVCGPEKNNNIYDCFAISQHYGSVYSGHYTSVCRNIDGKWYKYDDSHCSQTSDDIVNSSAFVIFFRRKND
jgi:ubiquitin C-terminal hydrolase